MQRMSVGNPSPARPYERDLGPYLKAGMRVQLAHAVGHVGLVVALRQISARAVERRVDGRGAHVAGGLVVPRPG